MQYIRLEKTLLDGGQAVVSGLQRDVRSKSIGDRFSFLNRANALLAFRASLLSFL